nr:MAG TPA: hypothetical protein [Bacteriophage sp.]
MYLARCYCRGAVVYFFAITAMKPGTRPSAVWRTVV